MHPVIAKLTPIIAQIRADNSKTLESISLNPSDIAELGIRPGEQLFGVPVIPDASRPKLSAALGVTQEHRAFAEQKLRP